MTKSILLWLGFCSVLTAQKAPTFTASPAVFNFAVRSPKIYPGWRYLSPSKQLITITTTQNWTVTVGGALSTACMYQTACFSVTGEYDNIPVTSGSPGTYRLAVDWYGNQGPYLDSGNYSGTITFSPSGIAKSTVLTVNLQVAGASDLPASVIPKATALTTTGCVAPDPLESYTLSAQCDVPNEAPVADPALTQPAVGKSVTDPVFGTKISRITGPGCATEYGSTTAFSAKNTYVFTSCGFYRNMSAMLVSGAPDPTTPTDMRAKDPPVTSMALISMSALDDSSYFYFQGSQLRQRNFLTSVDTLLADYGVSPYNFQTLYAGGTASTSSDDWLAFYDYTSSAYPKLCAVNIPALRTAGGPNGSNTFCGTYQGSLPLSFLDWTGVSDTDTVSGKRYVYLSSIPVSMVFSVGTSGILKQENIVPEWPGWARNNDDGICTLNEMCYSAAYFTHTALFKDRDGQVKLFGLFYDILLNRYYLSTFRLSAGLNLLRLEESGGGQRILGRFEWDSQPGCSSMINGCVAGAFESVPRFATRVLQASSTAGTTTLTLSSAPPWTPGAAHPVRIQNGAGGWACLNGLWNATPVAGNLITIPANCPTATGSLDKVLLGDAAQPFSGILNANRSQIQVFRPERQIQRVAMHRSIPWNDIPGTGINNYWATPRASISRDGQYVAFNSNWGGLDFDGPSVYVAATGLGVTANAITFKSLTPAKTSAALSYTAGTQSCKIELSSDPGFQKILETYTDAVTSGTRSYTMGRSTALKSATNYWVRMQCGQEVESAYFRTSSGTSGTSVASVTVAATTDHTVTSVAVEYRTQGTGFFNSTPAVSCGSGCKVSWLMESGSTSEYRVQYKDGAGNIRMQSDIQTYGGGASASGGDDDQHD